MCDLPASPDFSFRPTFTLCELHCGRWEANHRTWLMHGGCSSFTFTQRDRFIYPNLSLQKDISTNTVRRLCTWVCLCVEMGRKASGRGTWVAESFYDCLLDYISKKKQWAKLFARTSFKFFKNIENIFFSARQHTYYTKPFGTDSLAIKKGNELLSAKSLFYLAVIIVLSSKEDLLYNEEKLLAIKWLPSSFSSFFQFKCNR